MICKNCNSVINDDAKFCTNCGAPAEQQVEQTVVEPVNEQNTQQGFNAEQNFNNDFLFDPEKMDIQQNKAKAVLSYFGILVLVPIFGAKNSKFARFHANQGLVLMIFSFISIFLQRILNSFLGNAGGIIMLLSSVFSLINLALFAFSIIGIVNAAKGKMKEVPVVGQIKILK